MNVFRGLLTLACVLALALAANGCGGDDAPDTDGDLSAEELAQNLPEGEFSQVTAVDVVGAKEAAGLPPDTDPIEPLTTPEGGRFFFSTFFAFRSVAALVENPVRDALDHSLITAYAAHAFLADDAVTLVSTSQDFDEIASSLEEAGWDREGDVLSTTGDPLEITYTAVAAGNDFLVLGYDPEVVGSVAAGETEPSQTGELELLEELEPAPVTYAAISGEKGFEGGATLDCVESVTYTDPVDGTSKVVVTVPEADVEKLPPDLEGQSSTLGFDIESVAAEGDAVTIDLLGRDQQGLENSPALFILNFTDENGDLLYDCG